ncbi:MAG: MFS transporter [Gammaproteobacteria bacterium]|nr:MFS transporter [Gammaproteobacteria bacterium]NIM72796.1 MFS transporter [Gammaproteobacteria bacterium]NIN38253.1 MFS transporter [Gammaproteobacteria bacterium]NIO24544.1 MFS transporter [Gammaproteobacteria bacterium]NIO65153.1 MFS transporter [Gammaproteobacteria bacterium]
MGKPPRRILPAIIFSQFTATSLWFAGNAVLPDLQRLWQLSADALGYMTSSVQIGFISGTLVFAVMAISDRFSPRRIFLACSLAGALCNASVYLLADGLGSLMLFRFLTGFFLAGIYPIGMKIAAGWYQQGLGRALGYLVGALVLGTAFPHLLASIGKSLPWTGVVVSVSAIAAFGGLLMYALVPDGPYLRHGAKFDPGALRLIFQSRKLRSSAFGYFGHMWELYAFWAFVPVILASHVGTGMVVSINIPLWAFIIIGVGSIGCAAGGLLAVRFGSARIASAQLALSGICCLISPLLFAAPTAAFLVFLVIWGITVAGDSPQFSALNALNAPESLVGSALTIVNCIGFSITVVSIQLLSYVAHFIDTRWLFVLLALGPIAGLSAMRPLLAEEARRA